LLASKYFSQARDAVLAPGWQKRYTRAIDPKNPEVKTLAERIVRGVPNEDKQQLITRVFGWVTREIEYRSDPGQKWKGGDYVKPPLQTIHSRAGDCDDSSVLLASLLEALGFNTYLIFLPRHVFVLVEMEPFIPSTKLGRPFGHINGRPVFALESTRSNPIFGPPSSVHKATSAEIKIYESSTSRLMQLDSN